MYGKFKCALTTLESEPDNMDNMSSKEILLGIRMAIIDLKNSK